MGSRRIMAVCCALLGVALVAAPTQAAFPGKNGKIAFDAERAGDFEVFSVNPDGTGVAQLTDNPAADKNPAWSPDGTKIAFSSDRVSNTADVWTMDADGSNAARLTNVPSREVNPAWSPDGSQLVFSRLLSDGYELWKVNTDGTNAVKLLEGAQAEEPSWSPDGAAIALGYHPVQQTNPDITTFSPSGALLWSHSDACFDVGPDWAPDASRLVYEGENRLLMIDGNGTNPSDPNCFSPGGVSHIGESPAWSPDGTKIAYLKRGAQWAIFVTDTDFTTDPEGLGDQEVIQTATTAIARGLDWQPIPINSYPRPKGATPFRASLVIAYKNCTAPNEQHGPALAFPSCAPPVQESDWLTTGTADSNGQATQFVGSLRLDTIVGDPATPADEADVAALMNITDVRNKADMTDYTGVVQGSVVLRMTDRFNAVAPGGGGDAATVVDIPFPVDAPCGATADPLVGATCAVTTSLEAIVPGAVREHQRSVWQIGQVQVYDGGADGNPATGPNTLFARQGVFVP